MFKCNLTSDDLSTFRNIIDVIAPVIDEAKFVATGEGWRMQAMDQSKILLIDLFISKGFFKEYECKGDVNIELRIPDLNKLLKRSSSEEAEITLDEKTNKVNFKFMGKTKRTHKLKMIEVMEDQEIPPGSLEKIEPKLENYLELITDDVKTVTGDALLYSDAAILSLTKEKFLVEAAGDTGDYELEIALKEENKADVKSDIKSSYALSYLTYVLKASSFSDLIKVRFSSNNPILMEFPFKEDSYIKFLLAPRVEEEEELEGGEVDNELGDDFEFDE